MEDLKEISLEMIDGDSYFTVSTNIKRYINNAYKQKEKHPTLVDFKVINPDGYVMFRMPDDWFPNMKPRRTGRVFTEDEKKANAERLRKMHQDKKENKQ